MKIIRSYSILISLFLLILIGINNVDAFRTGDIIRFSKKSIHDLKSTDWTDIKNKFSPRFKIDKTITLNSLTSIDLTANSLYKISFQFIDKFTTTWITVADGSGTFLNHIEFTFYYSNDKIVDVKYKLDYNDEEIHHGKKPENFYLIYKWEQVKDKDLTTSLFVLFFTGIAFSGFIFTYNALRLQMDYVSPSSKKRKEELPTSFTGYNTNNDWKTFSTNNHNNNNQSFFDEPKMVNQNINNNSNNNNNNNPSITVNKNENDSQSGDHFGFEAVADSDLINFDSSPNLTSSLSPPKMFSDHDKNK